MTISGKVKQDAIISDDDVYRYQLRRTWNEQKPTLAFIMLNPSTADEVEDDSTITRCIDYADRWNYGKLVVGNLFALRSTDPALLEEHSDPIGPENDDHLLEIVDEAEKVVAAWGHRGHYRGRDEEVIDLLDQELFALGTTKDGHPWHPLRKPKDVQPEKWP